MPAREPKFQLADADKAAIEAEMRALLYQCARERRTITYSGLAEELSVYLHPHSFVFSRLLRSLCQEEIAAGRPILCALVVSKATGIPGGGYFAGVPREANDFEARWREDLEAVYDYFAKND